MTTRIPARPLTVSLFALAISMTAASRAHAEEPAENETPPAPAASESASDTDSTEDEAEAAESKAADATPQVVAPPGHHLEQKRYLGPIIGGGVGLGVGWAASVVTGLLGTMANMTGPAMEGGQHPTQWGLMFVPIAGPFAVIGTQPASQRNDGMTAALALMGGVQVIGAATLFAGLAAGSRTVVVPDRKDERPVVVQPVAGPGLAGVQLSGVF